MPAVQSSGGLGMDTFDRPGLPFRHLHEDPRNEGKEIFKCVARRHQDEDEETRAGQILLELKVLIGRDENLITCFVRSPEEFPIFQAGPALLLHGSHVKSRQLPRQLSG